MSDGVIKVSVIIPVFNAEDYIEKCIKSVLSQSLEDIEVICVDDGSTDNSKAILEKMAEGDSRIKVFSQVNSGAGIARNLGLKNAIGKFIAFMDSDDYYPDKYTLERLVEKAEENNALICGGSMYFDWRGSIKKAFLEGVDYCFKREGFIEYRNCQQDYYYQRFIFNREMIVENDLFFPRYRRYQDPPFFVRAMLKAERFYAIPEASYCYRTDKTGIVWTPEKVYDRLEALDEELNITREAGLDKLHKRVESRIDGVLNSICENSAIAHDPKTKFLFEKIYSSINKELYKSDDTDIVKLERRIRNIDSFDDHGRYKKPATVYSKLKGGINCLKDHGLGYTLWLAKEKFVGVIRGK